MGISTHAKKERAIYMSTFTKFAYHIIFSTKGRYPLIDPGLQENLYRYVGGIIRAKKGYLIEIGGIEDHVHALASLSPTKPVSDVIRDIKANASRWMNEQTRTCRFEWQKGYGAFTVSYSHIELVRKYIQNQKEHHKKQTFENEYMGFLQLHDIPFEKQNLFEDEFHA